MRNHQAESPAQLSLLDTLSHAALMRFIIGLPKVDLHRHLTGSISARTAIEIAAKHEISISSFIERDLRDFLFGEIKIGTHERYFAPWGVLNQLFDTLDSTKDVVRSVIRDAVSENIKYLELRVGPRNFLGTHKNYSFFAFMQALIDSTKEMEKQHDIFVRYIIGIPRHVYINIPSPTRNKMLAQIVDIISDFRSHVVGVDLNGEEAAAPAIEFTTFFKLAKRAGFKITVHAGEIGIESAENVEVALHTLQADRIGHGLAAFKDPRVEHSLSKHHCVWELCPTSNALLGSISMIRELPIKKIHEYDQQFVICTDNPARCQTTLNEELYRTAVNFAWDTDNLIMLSRTAIIAAFCENAIKAKLLARLETWLSNMEFSTSSSSTYAGVRSAM